MLKKCRKYIRKLKFDLMKNFFYNIIVKSYTGFICLLLIYSQANIEKFLEERNV